jgi:hypothetical protein
MSSRKCESQGCEEFATYRCAGGHFVCLWHTVRTVGTYSRRCLPCLDSGVQSSAEGLSTTQMPRAGTPKRL